MIQLSDIENRTTNIEGVDSWAEQELTRPEITVTLRANDIGVENDGGLLTVTTLLNVPYPLIDVQIGCALDADETRTLIKMLTYSLGLLEPEQEPRP